MTVTIGFQSPTSPSDGETVHERRLQTVPAQIAQEMTSDFAAFQASASHAEQYKMYSYAQAGRERQIPLDFGEISAIEVSMEETSEEMIMGAPQEVGVQGRSLV